MNIFVGKNDHITVDIYVWKTENDLDASEDKESVPKDSKELSTVVATFKRPAYKDSVRIFREARITGGEISADLVAFQDGVLRSLLVKIKAEDEVYEATTDRINSLHPAIARAAVAGVVEKITI